jgi:hypothetical protein
MKIAGLPKRINDQLALLPDVKSYFEALAANPALASSEGSPDLGSDLGSFLQSITDERLRDTIVHIGRFNELPPFAEMKKLTNGDCAESYRTGMEYGWANLRFLLRVIKVTFMTHQVPLRYSRQVALFCKGCGEYKATGMFGFETKDKSYANVSFGREHFLDPDRIRIISTRKSNGAKKKIELFCVPCSSSDKTLFEVRREGIYASAREYRYSSDQLRTLTLSGKPLPKVTAVRVRNKEPGSETEKLAYKLSGKSSMTSRHFEVLRENRDQLEDDLGKDTLELLVNGRESAIYDKFGIRIIASSIEACYEVMNFLRSKYPIVRYADYIKEPKQNGYQALHATLGDMPSDRFLSYPIPIDLQIRTREMDDVAEKGTAAWGPDKRRKELVDHKLFLAITAFRHYLFGA